MTYNVLMGMLNPTHSLTFFLPNIYNLTPCSPIPYVLALTLSLESVYKHKSSLFSISYISSIFGITIPFLPGLSYFRLTWTCAVYHVVYKFGFRNSAFDPDLPIQCATSTRPNDD